MKITILGGDGYCGWATALYLSSQGHIVSIVDSFIRRLWDYELGVQSLTPIRTLPAPIDSTAPRTAAT
jgi:UDP-sulfoquinovose synthase